MSLTLSFLTAYHHAHRPWMICLPQEVSQQYVQKYSTKINYSKYFMPTRKELREKKAWVFPVCSNSHWFCVVS